MDKNEQKIWILKEIKRCEDLGEFQEIPGLEKELDELCKPETPEKKGKLPEIKLCGGA